MPDSADQLFFKRPEEEMDNAKDSSDQETACTAIHMQGVQYCQETSLHGFQYLTHSGVVTKIGWLVVVALSIMGSVGFTVINLREYFQVSNLFLCIRI